MGRRRRPTETNRSDVFCQPGRRQPDVAIVHVVNDSGTERFCRSGERASAGSAPAGTPGPAGEQRPRSHRRTGGAARGDRRAAGHHRARACRSGADLAPGHVGASRASRDLGPDRAHARIRPQARRRDALGGGRARAGHDPPSAHGVARGTPQAAHRRGPRRNRGCNRAARHACRGRGVTKLVRLASRRTFASLRRHRNYRLFFAGQITSVCGTWMQNVALAWLILDLTHSPVAVGLLSLARFGPFTLLGLFAGVVADRFDNRRTVIVTQSVQMVFSGVLAAVTLLGVVTTWQVYAIATLTGIAVVFDLPARQNLTVQLVGRDELPNAIALNSSLFNAARILGPAIAGVVIAAVGSGWCFAINSASFLAVLAGLLAMRVSELYPIRRSRPTMLAGAREGLEFVWNTRPVLVLTLMAAV